MPDLAAPASPALPFQGVTLLAVEDSRFASDALRLMAQRLGARLRRAERLADARRHLALYRPDAVLVDIGLPDGDGTLLIREVALRGHGAPVVLGMSGDAGGRIAALAAGAAGFVEKPIPGLAAFEALLARHLGRGPGQGGVAATLPGPDPLALRDDLMRVAALLDRVGKGGGGEGGGGEGGRRRYVAQFAAGIARSVGDDALAAAAVCLRADAGAAPAMARLVAQRLGAVPGAFARG
jgi:CheY-like chemotaxis protein